MIGVQKNWEIEFLAKAPHQGCYLTNSQKLTFAIGCANQDRDVELVGQLFEKVPALHALDPTHSGPPFKHTQLVVLVLFAVLTIAATLKFRIAPTVHTA